MNTKPASELLTTARNQLESAVMIYRGAGIPARVIASTVHRISLENSLRATHGNICRAAKLEETHRNTMSRNLAVHGIDRQRFTGKPLPKKPKPRSAKKPAQRAECPHARMVGSAWDRRVVEKAEELLRMRKA